MLWVALWGGAAVRRYDPAGRALEEVRTDASHTTSCCLGGSDGRTLFITSAATGLTPEQLESHPGSGRLFATSVAVPGPPARPFLGALPAKLSTPGLRCRHGATQLAPDRAACRCP